ncbi:MAG: helix-turn-helix domain-containing protein [Deltaproteobacteria bacterium]|nr:helix-turn-helix domain-containing protein [Deltaproteobacteria bacterium]
MGTTDLQPPDHAHVASGDSVAESCVLTVDEVAALLRLERKTVYAALRRGEIPGARRIGRAIRLSRSAVLRWLAEGQGPPRTRRRR